MEAQAAAIKAPARLPAIEGETYKPPDHSVTVSYDDIELST